MSGDSRSVLSRPAPGPDLIIPYGEHADHIADVRLPSATPHARGVPRARRVMVLFFHGGFWRQEYDRTHTGPLAADLASRGYVVITPEYRRTGGAGGWPATLDDVALAVRRLPGLVRERLGHANSDGAPLLLAGHSAGGHLALWAAAELADRVDAVVALAPVADLWTAYDLDLDGGAVRDLLGGGPSEVPERYAAADPMARLPIRVPINLVHGRRDAQVPWEFSARFAAAAAEAGDFVRIDNPDCDHFAVIDPASAAWPVVVAAIDRAAGRASSPATRWDEHRADPLVSRDGPFDGQPDSR